jgi:hypothetical protein
LAATRPHDRFVVELLDDDRVLHQPAEEQPACVRPPPVEAEDELVEIRLDVLRADAAVVRAQQPSLYERSDAMNGREHDVCRIVAFRDGVGVVLEAAAREVLVSAQAVCVDGRALLARVLHEVQQRLRLHVRHHLDARATELPPLGVLPEALALDSDGDDHLPLGAAPALAARRRAAEVALIHLDVAGELVLIAARPDHRQPQLLQEQPRGLVADPQLALQLLCVTPLLLLDTIQAARNHVSSGRRVPLEDRPGDQRGLTAAGGADVEVALRRPPPSWPHFGQENPSGQRSRVK